MATGSCAQAHGTRRVRPAGAGDLGPVPRAQSHRRQSVPCGGRAMRTNTMSDARAVLHAANARRNPALLLRPVHRHRPARSRRAPRAAARGREARQFASAAQAGRPPGPSAHHRLVVRYMWSKSLTAAAAAAFRALRSGDVLRSFCDRSEMFCYNETAVGAFRTILASALILARPMAHRNEAGQRPSASSAPGLGVGNQRVGADGGAKLAR